MYGRCRRCGRSARLHFDPTGEQNRPTICQTCKGVVEAHQHDYEQTPSDTADAIEARRVEQQPEAEN